MRIFYILFLFVLIGSHAFTQVRADVIVERKINKFYPNPASSQITFDFQGGFEKEKSFQIFNFIGKKILELQTITPKTVVDLTEFYRGFYIFQIRDKNGKIVESGKFQVIK